MGCWGGGGGGKATMRVRTRRRCAGVVVKGDFGLSYQRRGLWRQREPDSAWRRSRLPVLGRFTRPRTGATFHFGLSGRARQRPSPPERPLPVARRPAARLVLPPSSSLWPLCPRVRPRARCVRGRHGCPTAHARHDRSTAVRRRYSEHWASPLLLGGVHWPWPAR